MQRRPITSPRQIILVRHGRPEHHNPGWCSPGEMKQWIERYNLAVVSDARLPPALVTLAQATPVVLSSSVSRCVQSRQFLVGDRACASDALVAEAHLPHTDWRLPRAPVALWRLLFRIAWFCGFSRHTEPIAESSRRARQAAGRLIRLAEEHDGVMLIGHGIMNMLIAWHLRKLGWQGPQLLYLRDYWHVSLYREPGTT